MKDKIITVKPCWNSEYYGKECLESEESFGFFKSKNDVRPSSCTWIKKNICNKFMQISLDKFIDKINDEKAKANPEGTE